MFEARDNDHSERKYNDHWSIHMHTQMVLTFPYTSVQRSCTVKRKRRFFRWRDRKRERARIVLKSRPSSLVLRVLPPHDTTRDRGHLHQVVPNEGHSQCEREGEQHLRFYLPSREPERKGLHGVRQGYHVSLPSPPLASEPDGGQRTPREGRQHR